VKKMEPASVAKCYDSSFPVALEGIITATEYHQAVSQVNREIEKVMKKWCYRDGFIGTMMFTGAFILIPMIPGIILSTRRINKVRDNIQSVFANLNVSAIGYRWVIVPRYDRIALEITHTEKLLNHQKFLLITQEALELSSMRCGYAGS